MTYSILDSPVGELTVVARDGALVGLYMQEHSPAPSRAGWGARVDDALPAASEQLRAYFAGQLRTFDLPLAPAGTEFQRRVWGLLRAIPYGETRTYGELAAQMGRPGASRAVGLANGRNPISIVVPCHRVIGSSGKLTGYAGGVERKAFLLALEQNVPGR